MDCSGVLVRWMGNDQKGWTVEAFVINLMEFGAILIGFGIVIVIYMIWLWASPDPEKEALSCSEEPNNETVQLLRQIRDNTRSTNFWVKIIGWPVLIAMIANLFQSCA